MAMLQLRFFGHFQVTRDAQGITTFESDKGRALLTYLAVESVQAHPRSALTALLWPDYTETSARGSLRQALYQLRQVIGDDGNAPAFLLITRQTLQFNPDAPYQCDATAFVGLLQHCADHAHPQLAQCPSCLVRLRQAVDLYQGEFLAGFTIADSAPFEEWRRIKQEQFHLQTLDALTLLADADETAGEWERARQYAQRQLLLEPWREEAHRQIMRLLARQGQRAAAVAQYHHCQQLLGQELGIEPGAATTALYEQIRAGKLDQRPIELVAELTPALALLPSSLSQSTRQIGSIPLYDWGEMPMVDFFAGRAGEVAELQSWLTPPIRAAGTDVRLISLLGLGGIGKTTLAAKVVKTVAPAYDAVIWRSLLNAPPLPELVSNWLQLLSHQSLMALPASLDEQLRLLLTYLRQARCLLVLDNVESILEGGDTTNQAGKTRPGYEGYDQLFQQVGGGEHNSCLLLTSREQPYGLLRLARQTRPTGGLVRILSITGLDMAASQQVIHRSGLTAATPEVVQLINDYSGNPLALQLVSATITDFFAGDVRAFLQTEGLFFDGIRVVLDQQFARLSPLEHELLVWLAIEREAVTVPLLRQNLHQRHRNGTTSSELLEALHALQQRSLIEKSSNGLTLQNVITEYTTHHLVEQMYQEIVGEQQSRWQDDKRQPNQALTLATSYPGDFSFLNRFALLKACAKEYVRQSQARLILQPLVERLVADLGRAQVTARLQALLRHLQQQPGAHPGYAAGNLLNLLLDLGADLRGYDFSGLAVWQAYLREATVYNLNFVGTDLTGSNFRKPFTFIWSIAYSPDGCYLAGGSLDGTVFLWQNSDGQAIQLYHGHTALVYTLAFSPDGQWLVSGSEDKTICVWDRQRGSLRYRLTDQERIGFVNSVVFSPDSSRFASASDDPTVRVWDTESGRVVQRLAEHQSRVNSVAFDPSGKLLASGGDDGRVLLWDLTTGQVIQRLILATPIFAVAFHPNGTLLMCSGVDTIVRGWEIATGALRHTLSGHQDEVRSLVFHPKGTLLASSGGDEMIRLWDLEEGDCVRMIHAHQRCVTTVVFSPDGSTVASSSHDGTVCMWDAQTGRLLQTLNGYGTEVVALTCQRTGDLLAATLDHGLVRIWDVPTGYPRHLLPGYCKEVNATAFHPALPIFVCGCDDFSVHVWDLHRGKQRWLCQGHRQRIWAVAINQEGTRVASSASEGEVRIWNTPPANPAPDAAVPIAPLYRLIACPAQRVSSLAFSPDDRLLAGTSDAGIYLWHVASGEAIHRLTEQTKDTVSLAFSPDGARLAGGRIDHTICLWSVATGELSSLLCNHHGTIYALAFSPDGKLLASASGDHQVMVWDVQTGEVRQICSGHQSRVVSVLFQPDGQRIVSGSFDGVVKCWEVESGACLETFYAKGPYDGMKIRGVTGISEAQKAALKALGAVEE